MKVLSVEMGKEGGAGLGKKEIRTFKVKLKLRDFEIRKPHLNRKSRPKQ